MIKEYIASNKDRFLSELFDWLRIPSVSADSRHKGDVRKAAEFLKDKFAAAGLDNIEICETKGHPIVYAEKIIGLLHHSSLLSKTIRFTRVVPVTTKDRCTCT